MALTPEQQEKTDSVQHWIAAADAFMAVFGLRRVIQIQKAQDGWDG